MDKTININLGGTLFQIDEEAFRILRDYLQAINNRFGNVQGGHETIEDIESRIAEIFQSQKGLAGVITKENVEAMISIIGKPEDFDQNEAETTAPQLILQTKEECTAIPMTQLSVASAAVLQPISILIQFFSEYLFVLFAAFFGVGFFVYLALMDCSSCCQN